MAFNPDEYLAEDTFNPDEYLDQPPPPEEVSKTASVARGAVQGATAGWSDELAGWMSEKMPWLDDFQAGLGDKVSQQIVEARAQGIPPVEVYRRLNAAAQEQNPLSYGGGQIAGGVATAVGTGGAGALPKVAGVGAKMLQGAKVGTAYGAIEGAGLAEEGDKLAGTFKGAGTGLVTGGLLPGAITSGKHLSGFVKEQAGKVAEAVSGVPVGGLKKVMEMDKYLTKKLDVPMGSFPEKMKASARELLEDITEKEDQAYMILGNSGEFTSKEAIHSAIRRNVMEFDRSAANKLDQNDFKQIYKEIDKFLKNSKDDGANIGMQTIKDLQKYIREGAKWGIKDIPKSKDAALKQTQYAIGDIITKKMEKFPEYAPIWDDVIRKTDILEGLRADKSIKQFLPSKEQTSMGDWDNLVKKIGGDVRKEMTRGEGTSRTLNKMKMFDDVLKDTDYAQQIDDAATYSMLDSSAAFGEEMGKLRGIAAPTVKITLNTLKAASKGKDKITTGLNEVAKKVFGTKWQKPLEEALKNSGIQGMAATHMMLMNTDRAYRDKNRK